MSDSSSSSEYSDSSSEGFSEEFLERLSEDGIQPYQFEPEIEVSSDSNSDASEESMDSEDHEYDRLQSSNW